MQGYGIQLYERLSERGPLARSADPACAPRVPRAKRPITAPPQASHPPMSASRLLTAAALFSIGPDASLSAPMPTALTAARSNATAAAGSQRRPDGVRIVIGGSQTCARAACPHPPPPPAARASSHSELSKPQQCPLAECRWRRGHGRAGGADSPIVAYFQVDLESTQPWGACAGASLFHSAARSCWCNVWCNRVTRPAR